MIPKIETEFEDQKVVVRFHEPFPELLRAPVDRLLRDFDGRPECEDVRGQAEYAVQGFLFDEARAGRLYKKGDAWCWVVPPVQPYSIYSYAEEVERWSGLLEEDLERVA
jgi:hypothetical protein